MTSTRLQLDQAIRSGDLALLRQLIADGADVDALDSLVDEPSSDSDDDDEQMDDDGDFAGWLAAHELVMNEGGGDEDDDNEDGDDGDENDDDDDDDNAGNSDDEHEEDEEGNNADGDEYDEDSDDGDVDERKLEAPVMAAIMARNADALEILLANGASPTRWSLNIPLNTYMLAVQMGERACLRALLRALEMDAADRTEDEQKTLVEVAIDADQLDMLVEVCEEMPALFEQEQRQYGARSFAVCVGQLGAQLKAVDPAHALLPRFVALEERLKNAANQWLAVQSAEQLRSSARGIKTALDAVAFCELLCSSSEVDNGPQLCESLLQEGVLAPTVGDAASSAPLLMLTTAIVRSLLPVAEMLLRVSPDGVGVNSRDQAQQTPMHVLAFCRENVREMAQLLLAQPDVDVNALDSTGRSPLVRAILEGKADLVQTLLEDGRVDLSWRRAATGDTLLTIAVAGASESSGDAVSASIVRLLLDAGVPIGERGDSGVDALGRAAIQGATLTGKELLSHKDIDVNAKSADGMTALHIAAIGMHQDFLKLLLSQPGIDANAVTKIHETALHLCFRFADGVLADKDNREDLQPDKTLESLVECVTVLCDAGCDVLQFDLDGDTPLDNAVVSFVNDHGAFIRIVTAMLPYVKSHVGHRLADCMVNWMRAYPPFSLEQHRVFFERLGKTDSGPRAAKKMLNVAVEAFSDDAVRALLDEFPAAAAENYAGDGGIRAVDTAHQLHGVYEEAAVAMQPTIDHLTRFELQQQEQHLIDVSLSLADRLPVLLLIEIAARVSANAGVRDYVELPLKRAWAIARRIHQALTK